MRTPGALARLAFGCCCWFAAAWTGFAQTAPVITAISAPRQIVNVGGILTLSVSATGSPAPTYQWKRNGVAIAGATAATYSITSALPARDNGWYQAVVSNSSGATTSGVIFVNVAANPAQIMAWGIIVEWEPAVPAGMTDVAGVAAGWSHCFTLRSDGSVLDWGIGTSKVVAGATNVVALVVGYPDLALKSDGSVVALSAAPDSQSAVPAGLTNVVDVASKYRHFVALKSDGTVVAWGTNESGQTTVPAGLSNVVGVSAGSSHSVALKSDGTVVAWGLNDRGQRIVPSGLTKVAGISAGYDFTVALKADGTVVAWGDNSLGQTMVPAGLANVVAISAGGYHCVALKVDGTLVAWGNQSRPVPAGLSRVVGLAAGDGYTVAVLSDAQAVPTITSQPANQAVTAGQIASFTVLVSGTGSLSYQWRKDGTAISGATNATLSLTNVQNANAGSYTVVVSNSAGNVTSNASTLTVIPAAVPPSITTPPASQSVTLGDPASLSVVASGTVPLTYQWRKDGAAIGSATNATLTLSNVQNANAGSYTVVVTNSAGSVTSGVATLTVTTPSTAPTITVQPTDQIAGAGTNVTLRISVSGTPPFSYQWRRNGAAITGATSDTLTLPLVTTASAGSYTVLVTNTAGSVTSAVAVLTVIDLPRITILPVDQSVAVGRNVSFSVVATGTAPLRYQWSKDGRAIAGAVSDTLALTAVTDADAGIYSVAVSNAAGTDASRAVTLVVSPAASWLSNLSVLTSAGGGDETLIVGFVVGGGAGSKPVLIRAIGPSLSAFGVTAPVADPQLTLFQGGIQVAANDNWNDGTGGGAIVQAARTVAAFALGTTSRDSALLMTLQPGAYSAQVAARPAAGTALVELYDTSSDSGVRLQNISARSVVGGIAGPLTTGFYVNGNTTKRLLLRGVGPTLLALGVSGALANPQLTLLRGSSELLATNEDWWSGNTANTAATMRAAFASVGAFPLTEGSRDAAIVATLQPGSYNVQVSGADGTSGVALVEVYELP